MSDNYDDLLGGRVTPSASFKGQFPIAWEGVVEDVTRNPAYEYDPSKPNNRGSQKFWPDGNPVMNVWVTIQTNVRDPQVQGDDGRRVLVLDSKNKLEAVQEAVRQSGASFAKGGRLGIEWYGNDPNGKNPDNPPKLYRARYSGPTFDGALAQGGGQQAQAAPPTQPAQGGWGAPAAAPAPASPAPATGGWGSPPPPAPASSAPATGGWGSPPPAAPSPAQTGWGAPAASAPASSPGAGWGAPAPEPDPTTYEEFQAAFRRKGVDPSTITSPEQAAQVWALVKNNPNVA